jgi:hypothetical protein
MREPLFPSLYQINTRVWLTELSRGHCQLGVKHVAEEQESAGNVAARSSFNAG